MKEEVKEAKQEAKEEQHIPLLVLARAVLWSRNDNSEGILRIIGDGSVLLKGHIDEKAVVTILRRDGEPLLIFNGRVSKFRTQGHDYVVIHFPKRLMPMWQVIAKERDEDGALALQIALTGDKVKAKARVEKVKEG
jgi:hypothetical protein